MEITQKGFFSLFVRVLIGTLCCVIVGVIFFQMRVFGPYHPAFQFVGLGFVGTLLFFSLRDIGWRTALALFFVVFVAYEGLLTGHIRKGTFSWDIGTFLSILTAVSLFYYRFYNKRNHKALINPLLLALLLAATNLVCMGLVGVVIGYASTMTFPDYIRMQFTVVQYGFLVGLGIGAGILAVEYLEPRLHRV